MLRELRGVDGNPHVGTRLVALALVLLLAGPLTYVVLRILTVLLHTVL
jgi:hypothetical protein